MISLRLDPQLEQSIVNLAQKMGLSKSEMIRTCINAFIAKQKKPSAWEIGRDMFGQYGSGQTNLSTDRKQLLKAKIKAK